MTKQLKNLKSDKRKLFEYLPYQIVINEIFSYFTIGVDKPIKTKDIVAGYFKRDKFRKIYYWNYVILIDLTEVYEIDFEIKSAILNGIKYDDWNGEKFYFTKHGLYPNSLYEIFFDFNISLNEYSEQKIVEFEGEENITPCKMYYVRKYFTDRLDECLPLALFGEQKICIPVNLIFNK